MVCAFNMKKPILLALLCIAFSAQAQQMYRWVDHEGKVHYTDQPPPPDAKKVEEKKFGGNIIQGDKLPYSTHMAVKDFPVTLYTGDCGEACIQAKAYLAKRGIPYAERLPGKNPADADLFKKISKENLIPLLLIGNSITLKGFSESEWASALDQAGYPKTNPFTPGQQPKPAEPGKPPATPPAASGTDSPPPAKQENSGARTGY
jgi:hypothetical protein